MTLRENKNGSTIVWLIVVLIVISVTGATIAFITPSTTSSNAVHEAGMQSYYNANSGLNYILSMESVSEANGVNFSSFINTMGAGNTVSKTINSTDTFSYAIGNITTNGVNGTYQITNLIGTVQDSSGNQKYAYIIYGDSAGSSEVRQYTPTIASWSSGNNYVLNSGNSTLTISQPSAVNGDIAGNYVNINYGATINGNVVSATGISLTQSSVLNKNVCAANGDISVGYGVIINGDASANGNIDMVQSSSIKGNANSTKTISMSYYTSIVKTATSPNPIEYSGDGQSVGNYVNATPTIRCSSVDAPYDNTITSCGKQSKNATSSGLTLSPGSYKAITSDQDGVITLKSGTYKFCSFSTGYNTTVNLDISSGSNLTILVMGDVNFAQETKFKIKSSSSSGYVLASSVTPHSYAKYIYLGSSGNVTFGYQLGWFGTIYGKTSVTVGQNFTLIGAIGTPGTLNIGYNVNVIEYILADYADKNWTTTSQ